MKRMVVGFDGSAHSQRALSWALDEARGRDVSVTVVHAWSSMLDFFKFDADVSLEGPADVTAEERRDSKQLLDAAVFGSFDTRDVAELQTESVFGAAAQVLIERGGDADLLVVGSRGRGGFTGLLLGSVSAQLAHHAPCPLVIVPGPERRDQ